MVKTEEEALQVRREVEAGASIVELAKKRSLRPEARLENAVLAGYPSTELAPHIMKAEIDELVVRWVGGETETISGAQVDRRMRIVEGTGSAEDLAP